MIQVSTILMYINRFMPAIVLSAIVVKMDIEQIAVMVMTNFYNSGKLHRLIGEKGYALSNRPTHVLTKIVKD